MHFLVFETDFHRQRKYTEEGCAFLETQGEVEIVRQIDQQDKEAFTRFLERVPVADGIVIGPWHRPATTPQDWQSAELLKVLAGTFDNRFDGWVDIQELADRDIPLIDTSRSMTPSVAEFALAMTLNLIRDIPESLYLARQGKWKSHAWDKPGFVHGDLTGRRVGLAGFGSINRRYAELIAPFKCTTRSYDPYVADATLAAHGVERARSLVELAAFSEVFVVGLPPTPTTQQIVSREVINALPRGALFVLVTRMAVVEQDALWERIEAEEIAAAIDVFAPEPPPSDIWFRQHPNVLATPHIAGGTDFCHRRCFTDACKDAVAVLMGNEPRFRATLWDDACYQGRLDQEGVS